MRSLISLVVNFTLFIRAISAQKYVFAHVVVGDTAAHTQATWASDIALAKAAAIDAFMLDIAYGDSNVPIQVGNAFAAAEAASFKLAFSFDYLGGTGPWPASGSDSVVSYLNQYVSSSAYLFYSSAAFVSTFEGTSNIGDWAQGGTIRSAVSSSIYFVPDYTSLGPSGISPYLNDIEGAFSWNIWPEGATNMTDAPDLQWVDALSPSGKTYMMGVSPWFFHSASGGTEWVWRGDDMWADRWEQTFQVNPQFVEIVTWNDYGESHYIGPLHDSSEIPTGSAIYDTNNPHDSWRDFLPYYIATYKGNSFNIAHDQMQYWYHTSPVAGGSTCGVVGNNPSYQPEVSPNTIVEDAVFFSALLTSAATVTVQIGNGPLNSYAGTAGHNHWSLAFGGQTGVPVFCVVRAGVTVQCSSNAAPITATTTLSNGCTNYNAWVGSWQNDGTSTGSGPTSSSSSSPTHTTTATTPTQTSGQVCIAGNGPGNYVGLCSFCCNYGYCPGSGGTAGPCTCTAYGSPVPTPPVTGTDGVPLPGEDSSYLGLCSFACDHGYCPSTACEVA